MIKLEVSDCNLKPIDPDLTFKQIKADIDRINDLEY